MSSLRTTTCDALIVPSGNEYQTQQTAGVCPIGIGKTISSLTQRDQTHLVSLKPPEHGLGINMEKI